MHVSNLLRTVLKPQGLPSTSSKKSSGNSNKTIRRDGGFVSHRLRDSAGEPFSPARCGPKKSWSQSVPTKASCLCAPTNHPGSFRCRLHRGGQSRWTSSSIPASGVSTATRMSSSGSSMSVFDFTSVGRTLPRVHIRMGFPRPPIRPSRLSRMLNATELESVAVNEMK